MAAIHSRIPCIIVLLLGRPCLVSGAVVCVFLSSVRMFRNLKLKFPIPISNVLHVTGLFFHLDESFFLNLWFEESQVHSLSFSDVEAG
jgi:hypothetical protein